MSSRSFQLGFSGGEMSPGMFGLISDAEFRRGVETARNMIVLPQGGLRRRGGTRISHAVKDSTKRTRLVRFRFSDDQACAVEVGHTYFRLHAGGTPILAVTRAYVVSQTVTFAADDKVTWAAGEHTLQEDDPVQFTTTGTLATAIGGNIVAGTTYYANIFSATIIKLKRTPGGGIIDLTDNAPSGTHTGHFSYTVGDTVERRGTVSAVDAGTETMTSPAPHGFVATDRVRFTVTGGTIVGGLDDVTDYFVIAGGLTAVDFRVSLTSGGAAVNLTGIGTGVTTWHNSTHASAANFYCVLSNIAQLPPLFTYWYGMPLDGLLEIPTPFIESELFKITFTQSNDVMTFAHRAHGSFELRRLSATKWATQFVVLANTIPAPTGVVVTAVRGVTQDLQIASGGAGTDLVFTTDSPHGYAEGLTTVQLIDGGSGPSTYLPKVFYRVSDTSADPRFKFKLCKILTGANLKDTTDTSGAYTPRGLASVEVDPNTDLSNRYVVTSVTPEGRESLPSSAVTATNNLDAQGSTNTITWAAVTGARRYYIYREESSLFGYIGQVDSDNPLSFVDDGIDPDMSRSVPFFDQSLNALEHPGAVGYFQGRRWFAATLNQPQDVWGTRSGTESDLSYHLPLVDSDRIYFRVALREFAEVRHIVPTQHLLLLTSSGELRITPRNSDVLTPTGIDVRPQSYIGSSYVTPQVQGAFVAFAAERGGRVWVTSFDLAGDTFIPADLSVRAAHLFDGFQVVDSALARAPSPTLLYTSSVGKLLGCTFLPEQNVRGWYQFDTAGTIESVAAVPEGDEDRLYLLVQRGSTRYVERMEPQADATRSLGMFLDAAVTAGAGTVVAVPHPNGTSLDALVDGKVFKGLIVAAGNVTLPVAAVTTAHVGLRYTSQVITLPLALSLEAFAQGRQLNVNRPTLRVRASGSCKVGPADATVVPLFQDDGATLVSGFRSNIVNPAWANLGQVHILQDDPLPLEVTSMTVEVAIGGE